MGRGRGGGGRAGRMAGAPSVPFRLQVMMRGVGGPNIIVDGAGVDMQDAVSNAVRAGLIPNGAQVFARGERTSGFVRVSSNGAVRPPSGTYSA